MLRRWVLQFSPDLVICVHHFSDMTEDWWMRPRVLRDDEGLVHAVASPLSGLEFTLCNVVGPSRLWRLAKSAFTANRSRQASPDASLQESFDAVVHDPYSAADEEAWQNSLAGLTDMAARLREKRTPFVVAMIPIGSQVEPVERAYAARLGLRYLASGSRLEHRGYQQMVQNHCRQEGIDCVDLLDGFRAANPTGEPHLFLRHDFHWTASGHDLAARLVAEHLLGSRSNP
jgi:hypothetical protein